MERTLSVRTYARVCTAGRFVKFFTRGELARFSVKVAVIRFVLL